MKTTAKAVVFGISEGKIVLFVFGKIQSPGLWGDAREGAVAEFPAVLAGDDNALFGAEHHVLVHSGAKAAMVTGSLHLLAKQHSNPFLSSAIIHHPSRNFHSQFYPQNHRRKNQHGDAELHSS